MTKLIDKTRIAVLLVSYNRKVKTLSCIQRLKEQRLPENIVYDVFHVDDGSTDGTVEAVREKYPNVLVIQGNGNLYWNQGMRLAWETALEKDTYDYFLLLNDDTDLFTSAVKSLLETEHLIAVNHGTTGIMVGSTSDPEDGHHTYGGVVRIKNYFGLRFSLLEPSSIPQQCDTFNANCVLVSKQVVEDVGILSDKFRHAMGDTDYGLRARENGYGCWIVPGYVGLCANNTIKNTWVDPGLTLKERKALLYSPKGRPPGEWLYFVKRHAGLIWILVWLQLKLRLYFPRFWNGLRKLRGRKE